MKRLTKIIMVQWYLFDAEEIHVSGSTAVVGANGAGKSSILDGMQTVLAGGNKNLIALNKGSNEKSKRTIREYCLGMINDPNASSRAISRDSANTYLALCFADDETGETYSAGMAIWASKTDPKEDIRGYFITFGQPLSIDDFTDQTRDGLTVLPWEQVKDRLQRRFKWGKGALNDKVTLLLPTNGPGDFIRQFYTNLSAEPGMPMSSKTVVKALLSAIAFKPIADPTKFVRDNMLDPSHINIQELKDSLQFWKGLRDRAAEASRNIEALSKLEDKCEMVQTLGEEILSSQYIFLAAKVDQCYEILSPKQEQRDGLSEEIEALGKEQVRISEELELLKKDRWGKERDYENQDVTQQLALKRNEKKTLERDESDLDKQLADSRSTCLKMGKIPAAEFLSDSTRNLAGEILRQVDIDGGLLQAPWLANPQHFDALIERGVDAFSREVKAIKQTDTDLWHKIVPLREESKSLAAKISRLEKKQSPLGENTLGILALLNDNKIQAEPLCDLIDVSDESWRSTVEAVLGKAREALIVPPERAKEAIRLYRYEGKKFRGSYVVNTTKTDEWSGLCQKGSLAEVVITDNPYARAFVDLRLGNIIRVEKETELLEHRRAATNDLMLTSGGVTTMMREEDPILGRKNRAKLKKRLEDQLEYKTNEINRLNDRQEKLSAAEKALESFCDFYKNQPGLHTRLIQGKADLAAQLERLNKTILSLEQQDNSALKKEIERLGRKINDLDVVQEKNAEELDEKKTSKARLDVEIEAQENAAGIFTGQMKEYCESNPGFEKAQAVDRLNHLRDKYAEQEYPYKSLLSFIDKELERKNEQVRKLESQVIEDLRDFLAVCRETTYWAEGGTLHFETFAERSQFIREKKQLLIDSTLADYKDRAEEALVEVEKIFRDRFIGRLGERLKEVRDSIDGLNRVLKLRPFHDEYCQFRFKPSPELKGVYDFAMTFDKDASQTVGSLFDPGNDPESPHYEAIHFIKEALHDDEELAGKLQDYRNYFVFDVEMFNLEGQRVANLSHRIEKGSGGEGMAPFYLAIGSSLSTAYMIKERPDGTVYGGMNLAPFDEAFSKLDTANAYSCLEFLKQVHLQAFLAAPDDKAAQLASQVDTMIWIYRDGSSVDLDVQYLTQKAHDLLQSDNPFIRKATSA